MGGCCCSSRRPHLHGTPVYYYCPPVLEEHESLTSRNGTTSGLTAGLLVDWNLETSTPDTFRSPPAPLPYDMVFGFPRSPDSESVQETICGSSFKTLATCEDLDELDSKPQASTLIVSPRKSEKILNEPNVSISEEEDACPICLEEYYQENPKLVTKCEHHFHLSCILEWMERSDTCPICDQEMIFDHSFDQ
ncbi:zf-RING_2 domain-containing protein [Cephalotus follicularis]|uniref:RING-type E3 ubiquitin transferase n=1 Tax=Cephalotus follicularis TaxID=3775 RepID=A0A1Q3BA94_CEPFO|nr:zf-RING_2 domain-containing protein [Cephalotus follicularis]